MITTMACLNFFGSAHCLDTYLRKVKLKGMKNNIFWCLIIITEKQKLSLEHESILR